MGQYHQLFRLDKAEKLDHYSLGAGAKALEQIGNQTMMAGLALQRMVVHHDRSC